MVGPFCCWVGKVCAAADLERAARSGMLWVEAATVPAVAVSMVRGDARAVDRIGFRRGFPRSARSLPGGVARRCLGEAVAVGWSAMPAQASHRRSESPQVPARSGRSPVNRGEFSWTSVRNRQASRRCVVSDMPLPGEARPGPCPRIEPEAGSGTGQGLCPPWSASRPKPQQRQAPSQSIVADAGR